MTQIIIDSAAAGGKAEGWNTSLDKIEELKVKVDFSHWDGNHNTFYEVLEDEKKMEEEKVLDVLDLEDDGSYEIFGVGGAFIAVEKNVRESKR